MSVEWSPADIMRLSAGYQASCVLVTALELDIFTRLHGGPIPEDVLAKEFSVEPRAFSMLATALVSFGFLTRTAEGMAATKSALTYLSRRSDEYIGFIILHHGHIMSGWTRLSQALRTGTRTVENGTLFTPDEREREDFLMGMYTVARLQAGRIAEALDLSGCRTLLDIGGGPGTYAVFFCERNPGLRATIFDLPTSAPYAERVINRHGMAERVDFMPGDFLADPFPGNQDVAWLSQVLHGEGPQQAKALVLKAGACLRPGGLLCIQEFMLDDGREGPQRAALFSLNMLVETEAGQAYTQAEIHAMMTAAGAVDIRAVPVDLPESCRILIGVMPHTL